ncbi:MAG: hypothetical protein K0R00_212 [Herbinix sp.]|jgi:hypothetical protein|nr:hypothetical protein [Herbinix sp.]
MMNSKFPDEYRRDLFGKFSIFTNEDGELEIADNEKEIVMQNRETGVYHKVNLEMFVGLIKKVFPSKEEQKELLISMFRD